MPTQGPVTLNQGQSTIASILYFDQNGQPMPDSFVPPVNVAYSIDLPAVASSQLQSDNVTDLVTWVAGGVANLTAVVTGPNGQLTDTETVTCTPPVVGAPVLSSIKIAFSTPTP